MPFFTKDIDGARFVAWAYNLTHGETRYTVEQFLAPILNVPYISQWGPGADQRKGDCGPACIAMLAHYLTNKQPTVDEAAAVCGQPSTGSGASYTGHDQLRKGASAFGFKLATRSPYSPPGYTLDLVLGELAQGRPSIALIHYGVLRDLTNPLPNYVHNQDQNYTRGHWVVVVGSSAASPAIVYIHDPDYWGQRTQEGNARVIPASAFDSAITAVAPGCTTGNQGLVVV